MRFCRRRPAPCTPHAIDIGKDEQFAPDFLKIAPNNRIPAIVDRETGQTLMESGAIMLYLSAKHDRFPVKRPEYWRRMEWLMWQMGGLGPMLGQVHHFVKCNPEVSHYASARYAGEARRLYAGLNGRLEGRDFVAGEGRGAYTIADMSMWPWISRHDWQTIDLNEYPHVRD